MADLSVANLAAGIVKTIRARPWGLAVAVISNGQVHVELDQGDDFLSERSMFQIGSVTKTMTALLLAQSVVVKEVKLSTTVGEILGGDAAKAAPVSLLELATQRSGLPRLPPNIEAEPVDPRNPYGAYTEAHLLESLAAIERPAPGGFEYSNYGYMLLGLLLQRVTGRPYDELVQSRLFEPFGMTSSRCGIPEGAEVLPGYRGPSVVPWWQLHLPSPGGVASCIADMATYVASLLDPPTALKDAVELCLSEHAPPPDAMGLAWTLRDGVHWHNGGTGGFRSFVALHRPSGRGLAILANSHDAEMIDGVGFRALT